MHQILSALFKTCLLLALLVLLALVVAYSLVTRSLPQTSGTLQVGGLKSRVEVLRDAQGVPNIYAENVDDLFFAQGYVHAQDRLWQMELNRHIAHGQLAELFGQERVQADKFLRTIGIDRAARVDLASLDSATVNTLQRYADGVNAFIHSHNENRAGAFSLPLEFTLLDALPADWQPLDSLAWSKARAVQLGGNFERELLRARLKEALGDARANDLLPAFPASGPFIIAPEVKNYGGLGSFTGREQAGFTDVGGPGLIGRAELDMFFEMAGDGLGSNNWVIDGTRTTTGKPLLANSLNSGISLPAPWFLNGLHCIQLTAACPFDVIGFSSPGIPAVFIGYNQRIAWGVSNANADVQDLFVEKINPASPSQYEYRGEWQNIASEQQVIHVKGGEDVPLTIQSTRHGPILTPVLQGVTATLTLQWSAAREPSEFVSALLALDRAQNWNEFRAALKSWDAPTQNFVYADVEGNIGYQMAGRVPLRTRGDGTLLVPGWSGEYEWNGSIPFDELPSVTNPANHVIVTANNPAAPSDYQYVITREGDAAFRATRINELLRVQEKLSRDDFKRIQSDVYSILLAKLQKYLRTSVRPKGFLEERALKYVKEWDGVLSQESVGGALLEVTYARLVRDLFANRLDADLLSAYLRVGRGHHALIDTLLDDPNNVWWDDPQTSSRETRGDRIGTAYAEAVDWLGSQFGDWPPDWHWGRLHRATLTHPLAKSPLDLFFNYGPISMPGDSTTVFSAELDEAEPYQPRALASTREIIDLSDLDRSLWMQSGGESGQPLSRHYTDLTANWRENQYAPFDFTRAAVEKKQEGDLFLTP